MGKKNILLVDDHEAVYAGLGLVIEKQPRFKVAAYAKNKAEAMEAMGKNKIDIAIIDIRLKGESGIDICKEITLKYPDTRVIMLTSYGDDELILNSIQAGASGYLLKRVSSDEIRRGLNEVADGGYLFDSATTGKVISMIKNIKQENKLETLKMRLNDKEYKVLSLLCEGKSNNQIGEIMHHSANTIKGYISNIFIKLEVNNRAEAAAYAIRHNMDLEKV